MLQHLMRRPCSEMCPRSRQTNVHTKRAKVLKRESQVPVILSALYLFLSKNLYAVIMCAIIHCRTIRGVPEPLRTP